MSDAIARARIEADLDRSFLVEAAAGTGKTTALVSRIARLIASGGARITEIAAITFTERASGELVLRLRERLEVARETTLDALERRRLDDALADFEAAYVGTIHGFCTELLRARPLDAGVDPAFVVLGDDERSALLEQTSDRFLEAALANPPEGIRRLLRRPRTWGDPITTRVRLASEITNLAEQRDLATTLRRDPFDRDAEIDTLVLELDRLTAMGAHAEKHDKLVRPFAAIRRELDAQREAERTRPRDHDDLERALVQIAVGRAYEWQEAVRGKDLGPHARRDVVAARDAAWAGLKTFQARADADLAACLAENLAPALAAYEARKRALGVLDHLDTLLRTRAMLRESRVARVALRERFRFLFVDEVQDVDPVQKDVLLLLADDDPDQGDPARACPRPGSLYLVGDPKQAIYGFRRADLRTYFALADALVPAHAERLELSASFRPRPAIAALVNRALANELDGTDGQARYVPLVPQRPPMPDFPSVIALPSPRAHGPRGVTRDAIESALPDAIASFVRWLLDESGLIVEDPETRTPVPIAARHVALLFKVQRGKAKHGKEMARALERHGVPHDYVAPEAFFEREIVIAASALCSAIEWPDDALSVYATLHGPMLGLTDAELLAYQSRVGPLHPLDRTDRDVPPDLALVREALDLLRTLHRDRHGLSIEATLSTFLERAQTEVLLALLDQPAEARALDQLRQIARRADARGGTFRELARWIAERVEDPELLAIEVAADPEQANAVSLLTVHRAKGLELPVVILADPTTRPLRWSGATRYADPARGISVHVLADFVPVELAENQEAADRLERQEAMRLLYVAATRARDVLVVPTIGDGVIDDSWTGPLARALIPSLPRGDVTRLARLPIFTGDRSLLDAPDDAPGVRPGHHASHLDGQGVTFWDPMHLQRPIPERDPRGRTHLVERSEARTETAKQERAHADARKRVIEDASAGSIETMSARRAARTPTGSAMVDASVEEIEVGVAGGSGPRFVALATILFTAEGRSEAALARELGATEGERSAALALIARVHAHPRLAPLVAAGKRDVPYVFPTDAGPVVWGRAPFVVDAPDAVVVVGLAIGSPRDAARIELQIAATALARSLNRSVRGVLACASD